MAIAAAAVVLAGCSALGVVQPAGDDLREWSAVPLPADPALTARAQASCGGGPAGPRLPFLFQDRRTPRSAVVAFGAGGEYELCSVSVGSGGGFGIGGSGIGVPDPVTISTAPVTLGNAAVLLVEGTVSRAATRVEVLRADGAVVQASLGGGRWAAWWPGDVAVVRAVAYDADGTEIGRAVPPELGP